MKQRMIAKKLIMTALLLSLGTNVYSKDLRQDIDDKLVKCKTSAVSTMETTDCYVSATDSWEAELNKQYKLLLQDQPKEIQASLRNAQRAWVKYKESYINAMRDFYSQERGSIWGIVMSESKMNVTRDKAIDLYRLRNSTNMSGEEE
ncbi:lysozyme inhibitor LprI family protein [Serratia sp. 14-2641]|uniref:lysozyme inhibitor LprI family protein n=1 Tax=Serratia sp. 14-2641 TaxID=1841657 RepID=UPI0009F38995|nr:lysozyme inhibitor LprI family protein [Serratia sp. 14-2641]